MYRVADLIAEFIYISGVSTIPIYQGGNIMHLIDAIGKHKNLNYIVPTNEESLGFIVESYARCKGIGYGAVTSGPGGTKLATAIASAYYDSIPCIFFLGQVGEFHIKGNRRVRQRGFQETDFLSLYKSITKDSFRIENPEQTEHILIEAFTRAKSDRPGPVVIELPLTSRKAQ